MIELATYDAAPADAAVNYITGKSVLESIACLAAAVRRNRCVRYAFLSAFTIAGSVTTSWLVGVTMNHFFSSPLIRLL